MKLLAAAGITVTAEFEDVGENHYFDGFKGKYILDIFGKLFAA